MGYNNLAQEVIYRYKHCFLAVKVGLDVLKQTQHQIERPVAFTAGCFDVVDEFGKLAGVDGLGAVVAAQGRCNQKFCLVGCTSGVSDSNIS